MNDVLSGSFAPWRLEIWPTRTMRVITWNIERGLRLPQVVDFLESQNADVLILQEVDLNARRTGRLNVAEEIARKLGMNYAFGREFEELAQGSRGSPAYQGQATLSRWRLVNPRVIRFQHQSGFWQPRWFVPRVEPFQARLGGRIGLVTEIAAVGTSLSVYNLHLESRGADDLRLAQLQEVVLDATEHGPRLPTLVAGDLNFNASKAFSPGAFRSALGLLSPPTTPARGLFGRRRTIDWAFVGGAVEASQGRVRSDVHASDHFPISFTVKFP